jgi:hypothetical protein
MSSLPQVPTRPVEVPMPEIRKKFEKDPLEFDQMIHEHRPEPEFEEYLRDRAKVEKKLEHLRALQNETLLSSAFREETIKGKSSRMYCQMFVSG